MIIYSAWVIADANAMLKRTIDMFESPPYVQHVVIPQMQATSLEDLNLSIDEKGMKLFISPARTVPLVLYAARNSKSLQKTRIYAYPFTTLPQTERREKI